MVCVLGGAWSRRWHVFVSVSMCDHSMLSGHRTGLDGSLAWRRITMADRAQAKAKMMGITPHFKFYTPRSGRQHEGSCYQQFARNNRLCDHCRKEMMCSHSLAQVQLDFQAIDPSRTDEKTCAPTFGECYEQPSKACGHGEGFSMGISAETSGGLKMPQRSCVLVDTRDPSRHTDHA